MGQERSEVKVEGWRKQQVLLQGQPRSLVISIISNNNSNRMAERINYQEHFLRKPYKLEVSNLVVMFLS